MRTIIAAMLIIATTGAASAYCVSVPDDQSSAYVRNNLKRTICLDNELSTGTADKNWKVQVDSTLGRFDRNFVSEKLDAIRPVIPSPVTPSWP